MGKKVTSPQQKIRRARLFQENPHCFYCKKKLVMTRWAKHNQATLDHLDSKNFSSDVVLPDGARSVLCCRECNQKRNWEEQKKKKLLTPSPNIK